MAFMALTNAIVELPTQYSPTEHDCVLALLKSLGKSTLLELALVISFSVFKPYTVFFKTKSFQSYLSEYNKK